MNIKFNILIVLSAIALVFAIASQYVWTQKTYSILKSNQENLINLSITKASDDFAKLITDKYHTGSDSLSLFECKNSKEETRACFGLFDSILNVELSNNNLSGEFNYAFVYNDSTVYKTDYDIADSAYSNSIYSHKLHCGIFPRGLTLYVIAECDILGSGTNKHLNGWLILGAFAMVIIIVIIFLFIRTIRKIQKTSKERIKVINNMAHEFKTPIASIRLAAEMLSKDEVVDDTERVKRYSDLITFENTRLKFLGDQILQIALLEEEQISLNHSSLNANEVIETYINNYTEVRKEISDRVTMSLDAHHPFIHTDKGHFENIIKNLIENAFKYGGEDVKVHIATGNIGQNLLITVSDNGVGIAKSYHKKVFERFYRITQGNQYNNKGFGIGLYYIKSILSKMGGKISLESSPGKGTKFTITIKQ
ncbi:MAG: hypothetical protein C0592_00770 [Marinilabiliales bacterium]|nr:MAG: hypothetical protein C0592_00770 [Marinilabiliales bacterium]